MCATLWIVAIIILTCEMAIYFAQEDFAQEILEFWNEWRMLYAIQETLMCIPAPVSLALFIYTQVLVCQARAHIRSLRGDQDVSWMTHVIQAKKNPVSYTHLTLPTKA